MTALNGECCILDIVLYANDYIELQGFTNYKTLQAIKD